MEDSGKPKYDVIKTESASSARKTFTLVVRYLSEDDAGYYICYIQLLKQPYHEWPKKVGLLTVQGMFIYCYLLYWGLTSRFKTHKNRSYRDKK